MYVSIDEYGSEEIPDVFGRRRQMQGSVAPTRVFYLSVHLNEDSDNKNTSYKCLMRNPGSEKHASMEVKKSWM